MDWSNVNRYIYYGGDAFGHILTNSSSGNTSLAGTVPHDLHKIRRASLNSYFSKASVKRLEPMIKDITSKLLKRLDAASMSGEVLTMRMVYKAVTSDVINAYAFGKSKNEIDMLDFNAPFQLGMEKLNDVIYVLLQLPWLFPLLDLLPDAIASRTVPSLVVHREAKKVLISPLTGFPKLQLKSDTE